MLLAISVVVAIIFFVAFIISVKKSAVKKMKNINREIIGYMDTPSILSNGPFTNFNMIL